MLGIMAMKRYQRAYQVLRLLTNSLEVAFEHSPDFERSFKMRPITNLIVFANNHLVMDWNIAFLTYFVCDRSKRSPGNTTYITDPTLSMISICNTREMLELFRPAFLSLLVSSMNVYMCRQNVMHGLLIVGGTALSLHVVYQTFDTFLEKLKSGTVCYYKKRWSLAIQILKRAINDAVVDSIQNFRPL